MLRRQVRQLVGVVPIGLYPKRSGWDFMHNRFLNKGTAFTLEERQRLGLDGLLPPAVETLEDQVDRAWSQFQLLERPINRYQLLRNIMDTNAHLFYALTQKNVADVLPIIYTPTVGEACQRYGALYSRDHGLYISTQHMGSVKKILQNVRRSEVDLIVVTDGSRILGLGDLGANGVGISIGKCSLYVACGGIHPGRVLPIMLDVGTNNELLKNDPLYLGQRISRVDDTTFYALMDEFVQAVKETWPKVVLQFEDFSNNHCFDMLDKYRDQFRCFNDDIQGTGAVIAAGFMNAVEKSKIPILQQRIVVFGAGSAAVGVVNAIADLAHFKYKVSQEDVRKCVYLVDSRGLVMASRPAEQDKPMEKHKLPFARPDVPAEDWHKLRTLSSVAKYVRPTALIGLGGAGPVFSEDIIRSMCVTTKYPIIFPLSNPTSKSEVNPADAYRWTEGRAIVASGSPYPPSVIDGAVIQPSQGNNMYVFPGVGLGVSIAQPATIPQSLLVAASKRLSELVAPSQVEKTGQLYPPISEIRNVAKHVAVAVILQAQHEKICTVPTLPTTVPELLKYVEAKMYHPAYPADEEYRLEGS